MGSQDSLELAVDFSQRHGLAGPTMLWDASGGSWQHYDVHGQPFAILLDANGGELGRWGNLSPEITDLIG